MQSFLNTGCNMDSYEETCKNAQERLDIPEGCNEYTDKNHGPLVLLSREEVMLAREHSPEPTLEGYLSIKTPNVLYLARTGRLVAYNESLEEQRGFCGCMTSLAPRRNETYFMKAEHYRELINPKSQEPLFL